MLNSSIRKTLFLPALVGVALALPAVAHAEAEKTSFVRDGVAYTYTSEMVNGRMVLAGKANDAPFRLIVSENRVSGEFNHKSVTFPLSEVDVSSKEVASR